MPWRNIVSWNTMLAAYAQAGHVEKAMHLFDLMPLRDLVSWTTLLAILLQRDEIDLPAMEALCLMMPEWDAVAKNAVLSSLAQSGRLERAREEFSSMKETSLITYNIILSGLLQLSDFDAALTFFTTEMPEHNLFSWNTLLASYAQAGDAERAIMVSSSMREQDIVSWNSLLHALAQSARVEEAKQVFDEMPHRNIASWTSLLVAYAQHGDIDQSAAIFASIPKLDLVSWTAMLVAYAQHGLLVETKLVFYQMPEWNQVSWNALLSAHAHHTSQLAVSHKIFNTMPSLDLMSWSSMLGAYAQVGQANSVLDLFHSMAATAERVDEICFIRILHACNHSGGLYAGRKCFTSLSLDYGVPPTKPHFCCMVDILGRSGRLGDAEDLINAMPFVADSLEWTCLLVACRNHRDAARMHV
ncbi:pentatricopeptide repeat-containing protein At4g02750-like [Selaginella moellendorffii]|uniref:pentatricopeptide repeat-containing protein At4g02750-like n=1 Tax=Selaginella moellendorffii TaxID=88036 RepID=UPI000D1CBC2B|nr:pentatricopeptide repeat-containing protein At4g02750-like [Selaginella moellendorffii]|eukprot:XP_024541795.1 pentatricopeptide repeat-containing protein At4g02750-like [Selaginella moellendorffii]